MGFYDYFFERYGGAQQIILFHGTSAANLLGIMSQGLIPNPKKKAWSQDNDASFHSSSRASIGGIYLTGNLMTAISAGGWGGHGRGGGKLLVMVEVQPRSAFQDEDGVTFVTGKIPIPGMAEDSEYALLLLYKSYIDGDDPNFIKSSQDEYVRQGLQLLIYRKINPENISPQLVARVQSLLQQGWLTSLRRKVAHIKPYAWQSSSARTENPNFKPPDVATAEADYAKYMDQMTRTLKMGTREDALSQMPVSHSMRVMDPIRFTGTNRILAVFEIRNVPGEKYKEGVVLHYPSSYEAIPAAAMSEFRKQWESSVGSLTFL